MEPVSTGQHKITQNRQSTAIKQQRLGVILCFFVAIASLSLTLWGVIGFLVWRLNWCNKPVKWVVLPFKSSLATIKQVSNRYMNTFQNLIKQKE
jgi:hypothetical protein